MREKAKQTVMLNLSLNRMDIYGIDLGDLVSTSFLGSLPVLAIFLVVFMRFLPLQHNL